MISRPSANDPDVLRTREAAGRGGGAGGSCSRACTASFVTAAASSHAVREVNNVQQEWSMVLATVPCACGSVDPSHRTAQSNTPASECWKRLHSACRGAYGHDPETHP